MYLDHNHVKWAALGMWPDNAWLKNFTDVVGLKRLNKYQRQQLADVTRRAPAIDKAPHHAP